MQKRFLPLVAALLAGACGGPPPAAPAPPPPPAAARQLRDGVEAWFEDYLRLYPVSATFIGDHRYDAELGIPDAAHEAAAAALEQRGLDALATVDPARLDGADRITYDIFGYARRTALANHAFPGRLLPLDQFNNAAAFFAQLGSGQVAQPFATVRDYDNFLGRLHRFPAWADAVIVNMREGMAQGVVQPRIVVERLIPQLADLAGGTPEKSVFWQPVAAMPAEFPPAERERLTRAYHDAIATEVLPAYGRLLAFSRDEYLPKSRPTVGLGALPDGARWYEFLARAYTTTDTPVAEIHATGLAEVARIDAEIGRIMGRIGFRGTTTQLAASMRANPRFYFRTADELLDAYRQQEARVTAAVPRLFSLMPKSRLEVRPVEAFRAEASASAEYYAPEPDGSRPGIFYVNTFDLPARPSYQIETTFLHEAIPGHHFQVALTVENAALPRFQRFGSDDSFNNAPDITTAYAEGWALYAESLGDELGLYTDPYQKLGNLFDESWRAARLVVDTGLHAQGWSREQAIEYVLAHSALSRTDATAEVERYIAWPGQALAYKTGQLTLRRLRTGAEQALGPRFDLRAFHARVLEDGPMPLAVLEAKIHRWVESQAQGAPAGP